MADYLDWPSLDDPLAEQAFQQAAETGTKAAHCITALLGIRWDEIHSSYTDALTEAAVRQVTEAASWYHEGVRLSGECPVCGDALPVSYYLIWRTGKHWEQYQDCTGCHEPAPREFETSLAATHPVNEMWERR